MLQQLAHLALLPVELLGVGEILVLAAAAAAEKRTAGRHAVWRWCQHLDEVGLGVVLVVPEHPRPHALAGQGEGHHDHPPRAGRRGGFRLKA